MTEDAIWHILVKTRNGTVSLLKNLTETAARDAMQRLTPYWGNPYAQHTPGAMYACRDDDVVQLEAFGPEGKTLVVWPKKDAP